MNIENGMIPTDGDFGGEPETCDACCVSVDDCECLDERDDDEPVTMESLNGLCDGIDRVLVRMGLDPADYQ